MDPIDIFSSKAEIYAKYRWGYAPEAIHSILDTTGITAESWVADIGAGTGILTREFIGKVRKIIAVEPNPEMRAIATRDLAHFPTCHVLDGRAESTTLVGNSIDLIVAAQSVHWFEPEAARREFFRILKPGGWLAFCRNYGTDQELGEALKEVYPPENDTETLMVGRRKQRSFYFGENGYSRSEYPFRSQLTWDEFIGSLSTASFAPDDDTVLFKQFERRARRVFDDFSFDARIEIHGMTELYLGQISE